MGLFYVRVDVRSHVNNGPLNNLCIVCMWRCIVSWCSLISPCEWCGSWKWVTVSLVVAMARRTWSVATGLARDTLRENLTCPTPSKDCFFGLVSYVVSYVVFGCFYLPPERFRTENERFRGIRPEKGMKNLRKNSRKNSRNNPCKGFWTVQGFPPYHVKNSRWPVGSRVPMLARTNLPEKFDGFPFAGFSWYAGWVGL